MRVIVNDRDITQLVQNVSWSGDLTQNARKACVKYLYSTSAELPRVPAVKGDTLGIYSEDGILRFLGIILTVESSVSSPVVSVAAADVMWYLGKNKTYKVYEGLPQDVVRAACAEFNVTVGALPLLEAPVRVMSTGDKTIMQVISEAYGNGYYTYASQASVCVAKRGEDLVAVLTTDGNVQDIKYKTSIEGMVNRVAIIDDKSELTGYVQNDPDLKYGLLQEVYKQEKDKDAQAEARKLLKTESNSCSLNGWLGNWNCTAGKAVYIKDGGNGMAGVFLIKDDSHSISGGIHKMDLGVEVYGSV